MTFRFSPDAIIEVITKYLDFQSILQTLKAKESRKEVLICSDDMRHKHGKRGDVLHQEDFRLVFLFPALVLWSAWCHLFPRGQHRFPLFFLLVGWLASPVENCFVKPAHTWLNAKASQDAQAVALLVVLKRIVCHRLQPSFLLNPLCTVCMSLVCFSLLFYFLTSVVLYNTGQILAWW